MEWARQQRRKQEGCGSRTRSWIGAGHPYHQRLNECWSGGFDEFVEQRCAKFYAAQYGRPSLSRGLLRSIADRIFRGHRRSGDCLAVGGLAGAAALCGHCADEYTRITRRLAHAALIDLEHACEVFAWVLACWLIAD